MFLLESLLFLFGFSYLIRGLSHVYTFVAMLFRRTRVDKYGKTWALVTACTDGIGLGFAHELARLGFNIIQVGRNPEKLEKCEKVIRELYNVEVFNIVKDFSECNKDPISFFKDIFIKIENFDVCLLVNNVGTTEIGRFLSSQAWILSQNSLNLFPVVFMTRLFLEKCKNRKLGGGVINMSSLTAEFATPFVSTYAAGKSFGKVLTQIVSTETKLDMLSYEPGYVWTPLGSKFKFEFAAISQHTCAKLGVKALGNTLIYIGHWTHYICFLMYWLSHLTHGFLVYPTLKFFRLK